MWQKVLDECHVFNRDINNKHMLDLCTGWGRIIFNVALAKRFKFKSYTGVDFSIPNALKFYEYQNRLIESQCEAKINHILKDVLEFKPQEAKYDLITSCWCLGFFEKLQAMKILKMVHQALEIGGNAFFKESVQPKDGETIVG